MLRSNTWRRQLNKRRWGERHRFAKRVWSRRLGELDREIAKAIELPGEDEVARELIGIGATDRVIDRLMPGRFTAQQIEAMRQTTGQKWHTASLVIGLSEFRS